MSISAASADAPGAVALPLQPAGRGTVALLRTALRPYPGRVATLGALVLAATVLQIGAPLAIREVVDRATDGDPLRAMAFAGAVIAAGLLAQAAGLAEAWVTTDLGQRTTNDLRARLLRLVLQQDGEFFATNSPGALVERVDGDTAQLTGLFSRVVVEAAHAVLVLLGTLAMAWTIAPSVAIGLAITLALMGAALHLAVSAGHVHRLARSAAGADLFGAVEERLAAIEDVRASGTVELASWHVETAARRWLQRSFGAMAWNAASGATVAIASGALTAVAFAGAGAAAMRGEASVGDVVALLVYVEVVRRPVEQLARQAREVGNAVAGAARVGALLALEEGSAQRLPPPPTLLDALNPGEAPSPTPLDGPNPGEAPSPYPSPTAVGEGRRTPPPPAPPPLRRERGEIAPSPFFASTGAGGLAVELVGVGVTYPGAARAALADVSLVIPAGAFVGVVGRTGSGKSTLGRVLVRAIAPTVGTVRLGTIDLASGASGAPRAPLELEDEATLRAHVAVVGQEPSLFHATVRENVTLFDATVPDATVRAALERVGLGAWLAAQPAGLATRIAPSGGLALGSDGGPLAGQPDDPALPHGGLSAGEAQLLGLARAFVRDARLVVLDEPAARVDPVSEVRLVAALRELARGRTVVVVAHRGSTIVDASHVLELDAGRVVRFGPVQEGFTPVPHGTPQEKASARAAQGASRERERPASGARPVQAPSPSAASDSAQASERAVSAREVAGAIWAIVRGFPAWWVAAITLAGMVGYAMTLGSGVIQRGFVDDLAAGAVNGWWWAAMALGFGVVRAGHFLATVTVEPWVQSRSAATVTVNAVMGALRTHTWPLLPVSPGDAVGRLRDDAAVIGRFTTYLGDPVGQVILGGSAWWVLASHDPLLAIGAFAPIVTLGALAQVASPTVSRARRAASERVSAVTDLLADAFTHATAVRLAGASERVVAAVTVRGEARRRTATREALVTQGFGAAWRHVGTVASGVLLLASVRGLADGSVSAGDAALGVALTQSLTFLGEVYGELLVLARGSAVAFGRIGVLTPGQRLASLGERRRLDLWGAESPAPTRPVASNGEALRELSVRGLTYRYGSGGGIAGATMTLRAGTLVAVTGRAGAGKSTLVRALLGLVPATGDVWWNGARVDDMGAWMAPPRVAYTPQSPRLFSGTVRENILGVPDGGDGSAGAGGLRGPRGSADGEASRLARAIWLAGLDGDLASGRLSLETRVGPRGLRLSGGQQQRVAAARMFATGAAVVVVDDVSSALDEATEAVVWDRVLGQAGEALTVIAVTNRPSVIARASLVVEVEGGQCRVVREDVSG